MLTKLVMGFLYSQLYVPQGIKTLSLHKIAS